MLSARSAIPERELAAFCRRWKIAELALFGSALRDDFDSSSDVDLLVTFTLGADFSLLDHLRIQQELEKLIGRPVDLVSRRAIERSPNPIRKRAILGSARTVYAA